MRRLLPQLVFGLVLCLAAPATAQQGQSGPPASGGKAAALRLLETTGAAKQFDAVIPTMMAQFANVLIQQHPTHEKDIREVLARIIERMSSRKQEIIDQIAVLYSERFTIEEIDEVNRFFASGVGARFVQEQIGLTRDTMALGQRWGEQIGREIDTEVRRELKARGLPL